MKDEGKTKEQLLEELKTLWGRLAKPEQVKTERKRGEEVCGAFIFHVGYVVPVRRIER